MSNVGDVRTICDYIKKACNLSALTLEQHFGKYQKMKDILTSFEFARAVEDLDLVISGVCNKIQIDSLFKEIDSFGKS